MLRGLHIAATGMQVQLARQDTIANNLANVNTSGFKRDTVTFRSHPSVFTTCVCADKIHATKGAVPARQPVSAITHGAAVDESAIDFSMGRLKSTGNALDLALDSEGFFIVSAPDGRYLYTRDGSFGVNNEGNVVNRDGFPLMGNTGPINVIRKRLAPEVAARCRNSGQAIEHDGQGAYLTHKGPVTIDKDGTFSIDGEHVGQAAIVSLPRQKTSKMGYTYFISSSAPVPSNAKVLQGFVEESNVSVVKEMVSMIEAFRAYEFSARVLQSQDDLLEKAVSEVGRSIR